MILECAEYVFENVESVSRLMLRTHIVHFPHSIYVPRLFKVTFADFRH